MENSQLALLRSVIKTAVGAKLSPLGSQSLEAFLALPNIDKWSLDERFLVREASHAFDVGLPFAYLAGNPSADTHRRKIGSAFSTGGDIPSSLLSEVHAGALLCSWGAKVRYIPPQDSPTPDLECSWNAECMIDVEVVRGDTRESHKNVRRGLASFVGALQPGDLDWNVSAYVADASNSDDLAEMFDAACKLKCEQSADKAGKWYVKAVPLNLRDSVVGADANRLFAPKWWPKNEPTFIASSTVLGGNKGNPVVHVRSLLPHASYMNPIRRKASSGQRRDGNAYLIALDASELPNAHRRMKEGLQQEFNATSHVSAVMTFEPRFWFGLERKEWIVSVHINPNALIPVPAKLIDVSGQGQLSVNLELTPR